MSGPDRENPCFFSHQDFATVDDSREHHPGEGDPACLHLCGSALQTAGFLWEMVSEMFGDPSSQQG
jgi:hypothetical protein